MTTPDDLEAAALVLIARAGIPPDIQDLLVRGDPDRGIKPGVLRTLASKVWYDMCLEENKARFRACDADPRTFVRTLRAVDPAYSDGDPDYEISEGRAVELLAERERRAVERAKGQHMTPHEKALEPAEARLVTYTARTPLHLALWDGGGEVEVEAVIDFNVFPGSRATQIQPAEPPMVEVTRFRIRKPKTGEWLTCPAWIEEAFTSDESFEKWLLDEAGDQDMAAADNAADAKLEEMRERARAARKALKENGNGE